MYEMEVCYKIIFEALLEEAALQKIADKIYKYTSAKIIFVSEFGKILAHSCVCEEWEWESIRKKHITFSDYQKFQEKDRQQQKNCCIEMVYIQKKVAGYIVILYEEKENKLFFEELGKIVMLALGHYFEEERKHYFLSPTLKHSIIAWSLFSGCELEGKIEELHGQYIEVLFLKTEIAKQDSLWIGKIWKTYYVYENKDDIVILFYGLDSKKVEVVYKKISEKKFPCYVSECFAELRLCSWKYKLLKRMAMIPEESNFSVKWEKEWSVQGLYTYTLPLFEKAGLSDYRVLRLIAEDEKNNTDLYHTLKVYLLNENNVTTAAESLYIHRNTLVYRLKQIKECTGIDLNDNEGSRELLAFMMMYDVSKRVKTSQISGDNEDEISSEFAGNI